MVSSFLSLIMFFFFYGIQGLAFGQVPQGWPVLYADIQGGVNIPIGRGLGFTFHRADLYDPACRPLANLVGSFSNGDLVVSGRVWLNVSFCANDNRQFLVPFRREYQLL